MPDADLFDWITGRAAAAAGMRPRRDPPAARLPLYATADLMPLDDLASLIAERPPRRVTLVRRARGARRGDDRRRCSPPARRETWLHVCRDDGRMARFAAALGFFHPGLTVLTFPAWDCLPYDRVSPNGEITSRRIDTLTRLAGGAEKRAAHRADHGQRAGAARAAAQAVRRPRADARAGRPHPARPAAELLSQQRLHPHRHGARAGRIRGARRHRRSLPGRRGASRCGSISSATRSKACAASTR